MINILKNKGENLIVVRASGGLERGDFEKINPVLNEFSKRSNKIKLYIELEGVSIIQPDVLMEDLRSYLRYNESIKQIAVVGNDDWERIFTRLSEPFVSAEVRYFPEGRSLEALNWVED